MKRSDLRPGMEVAWGKPDSYSGARRAIVLGEHFFSGPVLLAYRNRYSADWLLSTTVPSKWARSSRAGVPCAVFQAEYESADGKPVPAHWQFEPVPPREIWGTWEDYQAVRAEHLEYKRKQSEQRRAGARAQAQWRETMAARLEALGVYGHPSYDHRSATFTGEHLEKLLTLAEDGRALRQLDPEGKDKARRTTPGGF